MDEVLSRLTTQPGVKAAAVYNAYGIKVGGKGEMPDNASLISTIVQEASRMEQEGAAAPVVCIETAHRSFIAKAKDGHTLVMVKGNAGGR
ncbi:unnamed protein product [Vitrella brassicaformis CCMP3155]|uniref:Uncharacterized protein n=1 Tax=Vitrella brassicaformis (strain CCMP3155) TaxID=1169540 RepID=A0A0G4GUH9_VITBC|nr:unnamed protein product [Vitrella brassicaformis CCMP3155]|mmetsp:Transcript_32310/g.80021  ORF Transcript_32310/g.80021 Transcript_32310/m.80021 type:complete len:90 (-) Transcript_32310:1553-1822(-)|eukprot:CEM34467.1 unnamed protein product [Vitrella brassicaformis CCMP3155]